MSQRILGLDLGAWSVKAVLMESAFRSSVVVDAREVRLPTSRRGDGDLVADAVGGLVGGVEKAQGGNPSGVRPSQDGGVSEDWRAQCIEAVKTLVEALRPDVVVAGFRGGSAAIHFVTLPYSDPRKVEQTIAGEVEDLIPLDLETSVLTHEFIHREGEGSLSLCALASRERVQGLLDDLREAGVDPRALPVDVAELFNLYTHLLRDDASRAEVPSADAYGTGPSLESTAGQAGIVGSLPPAEARLVVDIGHVRTLVAAASGEGLAHVRVLRVGGQDVTRAVADAYELSWDDAEDGKHADAQVVSSRHPAATDAAQVMSDVVMRGLKPLVQELRRTLQAIRKERRVRIARVDLLGGGARIRNLASYLADQLGVPVAHAGAVEQMLDRHVEPARRGAYGCALALALRIGGDERVCKLDLRVGDLAFAGQIQHLRARLPMIGAAVLVLGILLGAKTFVEYELSSQREKAVDRQFCEITREVVGREICEPTIALSVIREPASELGSFRLPERSGAMVAAELSQLIPKDLEVTVDEIDVTPERARISGVTKSFDNVDEIVGAYAVNSCFSDIRKGRLRRSSDGGNVEFQLTMRLGCSR